MRLLYLLFILLFTSCGIGFQYTTLNHAGHIDGIYSSNDYKIDTLNESQVRNKLRTDFQFRYDIAQYSLSQPTAFDWNNRLLGNRYNWNRPYWGYSYYWDRTQMWNDWCSYPVPICKHLRRFRRLKLLLRRPFFLLIKCWHGTCNLYLDRWVCPMGQDGYLHAELDGAGPSFTN